MQKETDMEGLLTLISTDRRQALAITYPQVSTTLVQPRPQHDLGCLIPRRFFLSNCQVLSLCFLNMLFLIIESHGHNLGTFTTQEFDFDQLVCTVVMFYKLTYQWSKIKSTQRLTVLVSPRSSNFFTPWTLLFLGLKTSSKG